MTEIDKSHFAEVAGGVTVGPNRDSWSDRVVEVARRRDDLVEEYAWASRYTGVVA